MSVWSLTQRLRSGGNVVVGRKRTVIDLADACPRQRAVKLNLARTRPLDQPLAAMRDELLLGDLRRAYRIFQDHCRLDPLHLRGIGDPKNACFRDKWMFEQHPFHLRWIDVESRRLDH